MLTLSYLGEAKSLNLDENTLKLLIVRRPVSGIPKGFVHVPHLSPSNELFERTQMWKENKFKDDEIKTLEETGVSPDSKDAWWTLYVRDFTWELNNRKDMIKALNRLKSLLKEGKEVFLFCYCKDTYRCHRSLVGEHMKSLGFEVDFRDKEDEGDNKKSIQMSIFD